MKILYVADLHGSIAKYDQVLEIARQEQADVVVNGGDMLPTAGDLFRQDEFIHRYKERTSWILTQSSAPLVLKIIKGRRSGD